MSRYFFHIKERDRLDPDEFGLDLPGPEDAYEEAIATVRSMSGKAFEVRDEEGREAFTLPFAIALPDPNSDRHRA
jgi:hypothetical protein